MNRVEHIRNTIRPVSPKNQEGYRQALEDLTRVAEQNSIMGTYVDQEVRYLALDLSKAQGLTVSRDLINEGVI